MLSWLVKIISGYICDGASGREADWLKKIALTHVGLVSSNCGGPDRTRLRKGKLILSTWAETFISSCLWASVLWFWHLLIQTRTYTISPQTHTTHQLSWFSSFAHSRWWNFSTSVTIWPNSCDKSPLTYTSLLSVLSLESPNTK